MGKETLIQDPVNQGPATREELVQKCRTVVEGIYGEQPFETGGGRKDVVEANYTSIAELGELLEREPPPLEPCCVCGLPLTIQGGRGGSVFTGCECECTKFYRMKDGACKETEPQFIARVNRMNRAGREET